MAAPDEGVCEQIILTAGDKSLLHLYILRGKSVSLFCNDWRWDIETWRVKSVAVCNFSMLFSVCGKG